MPVTLSSSLDLDVESVLAGDCELCKGKDCEESRLEYWSVTCHSWGPFNIRHNPTPDPN